MFQLLFSCLFLVCCLIAVLRYGEVLLLKLCFATDVPACIVTIDAAKGANAIAFSLPRLSFVVF